MCDADQPCLRVLVERSPLASLDRHAQAAVLLLSRTAYLAALAGEASVRSRAAFAEHLGCATGEIDASLAVPACGTRRPRRERGGYGDAVTVAAEAAGLTLVELQRVSGVDRSSFFAAVNGTLRPREVHVRRVAAACDADANELLGLAGRNGVTTSSSAACTSRECGEGEFGSALVEWMVVNRSNAAEIARRLGTTRQSVGMWVRGRTRPNSGRLDTIAALLGVDATTLEGMLRRDVDRQLERRRAGRTLRARRTSAGLSRAAAAAQLGVTVTALKYAETGKLPVGEIDALRERYGS